MDKIFITDLLIRGVIGITEKEREQPQDILVNVIISTNTVAAGISDNVEDSVNYRTVAKKILAHVEIIKRFTVEALAADVARLCLEEPHAESVIVKVEKPGAVRFSRSVGVEIERRK
jgi:FolB domain-containing protein